MMTRKDYQAIAMALAYAKPREGAQPGEMRAWERAVRTVADVLEDKNPRFDPARFAAACTIESL